mgnify:FL=1|jgi:hypothetical protein
MYVYQIKAGDFVSSKKLMLMKQFGLTFSVFKACIKSAGFFYNKKQINYCENYKYLKCTLVQKMGNNSNIKKAILIN